MAKSVLTRLHLAFAVTRIVAAMQHLQDLQQPAMQHSVLRKA